MNLFRHTLCTYCLLIAILSQESVTELFADNNQTVPYFDGTPTSLRDIMMTNIANWLTPGQVSNNSNIYEPNGNWGIDIWNELHVFRSGDLALDNTDIENPRIVEFNSRVHGIYIGDSHLQGDHVFSDGYWFVAIRDVNQNENPHSPATTLPFQQFMPYAHGDAVVGAGSIILTASPIMKGSWDSNIVYSAGDVVFDPNYVSFRQLENAHLGNWDSALPVQTGETVSFNGILYRSLVSSSSSNYPPTLDPSKWQQLGNSGDSPANTDVTAAIVTEASGSQSGAYFHVSPWQTVDPVGNAVGNPLQGGAFIDRTSEFTDLNSNFWRLSSNPGQDSGQGQPVVSNISYFQRISVDGNLTKLVDIQYDLEGNRLMFVEFFFSYDGGATFPVHCTAVSGASGLGVSAGTDLNATWDASVDWDQNFTNRGRIMIKATYGDQPIGIPGMEGNETDANLVPNHIVPSAMNLEMIWVEPGTFTMGSPVTEPFRGTDETAHMVTLSSGFYLGKYEVTQEQYEAVMAGNTDGINASPSQWTGSPNLPVEYVSWNKIQTFLNRLNNSEQAAGGLPGGWEYVLPTEAEWEYACRAGTTTAYSWGADINASKANSVESGFQQTLAVGSFPPNPWGFHDMHGNVSELVWDLYDGAYPSQPVTDPLNSDFGTWRVYRGGSWDLPATNIRSSIRSSMEPYLSSFSTGFRLAYKQVQ